MLDRITKADVKRLLHAAQKEGLAAGSVANIQRLISGIFTQACDDDLVMVNPARRMGRTLAKTPDWREHLRPLTREQVAQVLRTAQSHFAEHHPFMLCAFRTGMRLGELLGLAWQDIDFAQKSILVRRSFTHGAFTSPKSHRYRTVDMSDQLAHTLTGHRDALKERFGGALPPVNVPAAGRAGEATIHLVLPGKDGGPMNADRFRHDVFYPLLKKAGVPRIRIHDMRHTFASLLLAQGEPLHYVKDQMGHASIKTTVDVYGHLAPGANRNAVNRLDDPITSSLQLTQAG